MDSQHGRVTRYAVAGLAAITSGFIGSFLGDNGTLIGTGLGAVASSAAAELYGAAAAKARHHVRAVPAWTKWNPPIVSWALAAKIGMAGVAVAAVGYGGVAVIETAANRPLHAITTGSNERGSSFDSHAAPPATPTASPPAPTTAPTASVLPGRSATPSASPSASPTPDPSVPSSASPSAAPATPTATSSP